MNYERLQMPLSTRFWRWCYRINAGRLPLIALLGIACLLTPFDTRADIYISEFVASNATGLEDETGDHPDWIEIHNNGNEPVNLQGWGLVDGGGNAKTWVFPEYILEANTYLVIFASGENRRDSQPFHTDFELKQSGEELRLLDASGAVVTQGTFPTPYPEQHTDIAFGNTDEGYRFLDPPTPGAPNESSTAYLDILSMPQPSHEPGWFNESISLSISDVESGTEVFYTLDGTLPSRDSGTQYTAPITITESTTLRVIAVREKFLSPPVTTYTYLNADDVLTQSRPESYPEIWAEGIPADYDMDPNIVNDPDYRDFMEPALKALPVISLVTDPAHLFDKTTGIYLNTESDGSEWERPVSFEFLNTESDKSFQANAGIRIQGRSSRQARTSPKHSFRILFKHPYGPTTLNLPVFEGDSTDAEYNTLVFRATSNHSWTYPLAEQRTQAQYLRDPWTKATQHAMGHTAPKSTFAHLFLNGLYWGVYAISERPDDAFMATHFGGKKSEYDVIKGGETVSGSNRIWRRLFTLADQGLDDLERYAVFSSYVDLESFIDFMILNHYIGNETWDFGNWYAARRDVDGERFQFFCWDTETSMNRVHENRVMTRNADRPTALFHALRKNSEFQQLFSDRLQLHCTGDGALTPTRVIKRYEVLAQELDTAIIAESARWGDYRLSVHQYRTEPFERYTRNEHWWKERDRLLLVYFPTRTEILLDQYRSINLYQH